MRTSSSGKDKFTKAERARGTQRRGATLDYDLWANMAHVRVTWLECGHYAGDDHAPLVRAVFRELRQAAAFIPSLWDPKETAKGNAPATAAAADNATRRRYERMMRGG